MIRTDIDAKTLGCCYPVRPNGIPMELPPFLQSGSAAQQVYSLPGTVVPTDGGAGVTNGIMFTLPLPSGFTISSTSVWGVTLPPGFTLPPAGSGSSVSFFGLDPYPYNPTLSPPSTLGPVTQPVAGFPTGTLWVWSTLNNQPEYTGITLQFILEDIVDPTANGPTGDFLVRVTGTNNDVCAFTVPGWTVAPDT